LILIRAKPSAPDEKAADEALSEAAAMDDHFWPSVYPGLIVGALIGLADGSLLATLLGAAGGLGGAFAAFYLVTLAGLEPGVLPLAAIIVGAVAASKATVFALSKLTGRHAAG
jgi:hypothetical protein